MKINKIKWNPVMGTKKPKSGQEILMASIRKEMYAKKLFLKTGAENEYWSEYPQKCEVEHFYEEYAGIANIVECLLGYPKTDSEHKKAEYLGIMQRMMEIEIDKLKTE